MITEALGALIIIGALLVLVVRYLSKKPQEKIAAEEMRVSTDTLKAELTRSGDEIIKRMGAHIEKLENLLRVTEDKTSRLETRLSEYERLEAKLDLRIDMLERELTEAREITRELTVARTAPAPTPAPLNIEPKTVNAISDSAEENKNIDFASVLEKSMQQDDTKNQTANLVTADDHIEDDMNDDNISEDIISNAASNVSASNTENKNLEGSSQQAAKARALLLSGYSIEDTARETGLGKGAIELLRQMNKKEIEG